MCLEREPPGKRVGHTETLHLSKPESLEENAPFTALAFRNKLAQLTLVSLLNEILATGNVERFWVRPFRPHCPAIHDSTQDLPPAAFQAPVTDRRGGDTLDSAYGYNGSKVPISLIRQGADDSLPCWNHFRCQFLAI